MGLIAVSGQPGCRFEEVARIAANRLSFELVTASRIASAVEKEFAPLSTVPEKAYLDLVASIVARLATTHHLVICGDGMELLFKQLPGMLRVNIVAPDSVRVGNIMLDERLDRPAARQSIRAMEERQRAERKQKFGLSGLPAHLFDLILNAEQLDPEHIAELIVNAAHSSGLVERGYLSAAAEAQLQFRCRLRLSKHGIVPPDKIALPRKSFAHPSEQIFANLLDFYRIPWEYEPRSFPIQWDREGKVSEAFTPDFYLTEFDLYVELTTMKQSLVTRKNRKVKLLRELYPHVNIQVFYQKDFENLIFKYGLAERTVAKV
ncbi:MAG: cytidylate kinase family protein [Acidobacteriia bacterium]|nr:cytidylate kinase family protein [Terriglobia bacterium]